MKIKKVTSRVESLFPRTVVREDGPLSTRYELYSKVRYEICDENGNVEYRSQEYPNLITDRFLNSLADIKFSQVDSLRSYLVMGASASPKPEIKISSGSVQGRYVFDSSTNTHTFVVTPSGALANDPFSSIGLSNWSEYDLVLPGGEYAKVLSKIDDSTLEIDRAVSATTDVSFELWHVKVDMPISDRVGVSDTDYSSPAAVYSFDSSTGSYVFAKEKRIEYTVSGEDPINFSSFAFVSSEPTGTDPTNANVYELVRDLSGSPTVLVVNPGKKIRIYHTLVARVFLNLSRTTEVRVYDLADNLVSTTNLPSTVELSATGNTSANILQLYERLLSPGSDLFNGDPDAVLEVVALVYDSTTDTWSESSTHRKTFTAATLESYVSDSFRRSRSVLLTENDFVTTFQGLAFIMKVAGTEVFRMTVKFQPDPSTSPSSQTKDDLHELKLFLTTNWYRRYA